MNDLVQKSLLHKMHTKNAREDRPRFEFLTKNSHRFIHAFKLGLALSLLSAFFMLVEEPHKLWGRNAIWAIMTVVVVFEYTVGATLSKGLNRGLGTLTAAFLGLGITYLAKVSGRHSIKTIIIIASVFLTGALATYLRLVPKLKAKYDYGLLIFVLTFSLISVSSYETGDTFRTASTRFLTILVGCVVSLAVCMFVFPVWAGQDLHNRVSSSFDTLANCIQVSVEEYIKKPVTTTTQVNSDEIYVMCRMLLSSSQMEENLVNFAGWEPPHGRFLMFGYPWKEYLKVGAALRHCAYASTALHGCLQSKVQASYDIKRVFRGQIMNVSKLATQLIMELGESMHRMQTCPNAGPLLRELQSARESLIEAMDVHAQCLVNPCMVKWTLGCTSSCEINTESLPQSPQNIKELSPLSTRQSSTSSFSLATFTYLLIETVARIENLVKAVENLEKLARFKQAEVNPHILPNTRSYNQNAVNTDVVD